ncbi:MAG: NUDIX hydrolase [Nonlabens sp.]
MKYKIIKEDLVFDDFLKIYKSRICHDSFSTNETITVDRLCLERGNAVAVLLYESDTDSFLFTKQFRYPAARRSQRWSLELAAGVIDKDETAAGAARREVLEELGYEITELETVHQYFPSPGVSSELITIFYAAVSQAQQLKEAGGSKDEQEDIKLVKIPRLEALQLLEDQKFNNSITLIGMQWYALNQTQ